MIEFANPAALWFLALIVPIVLLYLLKRRRQDRIVPSTLLWKQALEDTQAHTPFQKLRSNLLLLLQILVVVLLTALLAQPYLPMASKESREWILVIDRSASMQATDEKPNRFAAARKKLTDILESIAPVDEVMLIALGSDASILQNFTRDHDRIRQKLGELEPEDVAGEWEQLLSILKPLLKKSPRPGLIIASDFANLPDGLLRNVSFDSVPVGLVVENIGITRAVIEPLPDTMQEQLLFFQIKNYSNRAQNVDVQIHKNSELIDAFEIPLPAKQEAEKAVRVTVTSSSNIDIRVQSEDVFMLDNDFTLIANARSKVPVQLDIANPFLKRALEVVPSLQLTAQGRIKVSNTMQESPGLYFLTGNSAEVAPIVQWNVPGPQLRFVDAGLWRISNHKILELPAGATPLLETSKGVVGYAQDQEGQRRVVLGFRIEDSNLALLAGFPIFIGNTIEWIQEGLDPKLPTLTNREYTQEGAVQEGKAYVNFANSAESELTPQRVQDAALIETKAALLRQDYSKWFLLALLGMVILEWWVFHRKESV